MKLGEVLSGGQGGGGNRNLRTGLLAVLALAAAYGAYTVFGESEPPPAPENAVLPKKRPAAVAQATPAAPAGKTDPKAKADPKVKADAKAPAKPDPKATAKPADAAKTVSVPSKPAPVAKAPAPAPAPAPAAKATPAPAAAVAKAPAPVPAPPVAAAKSAPTTTQSVATPRQGASPEAASVTIQREVFSYDPGRRRDPFVSLAKPSEVGPLLGELKLIGIAYDEVGRNSVAVLRDQAKGLYRVKIGQSVGRARVATIGRRSVTFNVDEFGVTRQEVMTLRDSTKKGM